MGGGINQAATLPLKRLRERGFRNLDFIRRKAQNLIFMNPIGLISGRPVSLEDARATTYLGGAFAVVKGKVVYAHRDQAIADHFDMEEMLRSLGVPPQQGETYTLPTTATNPSARPSTETLFRPSGGVPGGPTPTYNPGQSGNFQGRSN